MVPIERITNDILPEGTVLEISDSNIWAKQIFGDDIKVGDLVSVLFTHGEVVMFKVLRNGIEIPIGISEDCFKPFDK